MVITIGAKLNISPLELFNTDLDNFILLLNYFVMKEGKKQNEVIATNEDDGFWDM